MPNGTSLAYTQGGGNSISGHFGNTTYQSCPHQTQNKLRWIYPEHQWQEMGTWSVVWVMTNGTGVNRTQNNPTKRISPVFQFGEIVKQQMSIDPNSSISFSHPHLSYCTFPVAYEYRTLFNAMYCPGHIQCTRWVCPASFIQLQARRKS